MQLWLAFSPFATGRGAFLSVVVIVLLIVGLVMLVSNLAQSPPPLPQFEPVEDEGAEAVPAKQAKSPRRRA